MVSSEKNFLFIHVPKTGGTSVQSILHKYSDDELISLEGENGTIERFEVVNHKLNTSKHSSLQQYRDRLDTTTFNSLFKIATLRNPWDMMISFYFSPHGNNSVWNRDAFIELIEHCSEMKEYFYVESIYEKINRKIGKDIIPLKKTKIDSQIDHLMRFECLDEDFKNLCQKLGISHETLPHKNASKKGSFKKYYDDELIERVEKKFKKEIEFGSYDYSDL